MYKVNYFTMDKSFRGKKELKVVYILYKLFPEERKSH